MTTRYILTQNEINALEYMVKQGDRHGTYDLRVLDVAYTALEKLKEGARHERATKGTDV